MDFGFSEQQEMLRTMARDFLTKECTKAKVRELDKDEQGYSPQMWKNMANLGWQGLVFPEKYGGTEASFVDLVVLVEEMGRNITPGPFFSTVALCALPILEFGTEEQKLKYLPRISSGENIWTLALIEPSASYKPSEITLSATAQGDNYVLNGEKIFVADAHIADFMLAVARTDKSTNTEDGITLFIVNAKDPTLKMEHIPTMAGDRQFQIIFNNVNVTQSNILGTVYLLP